MRARVLVRSIDGVWHQLGTGLYRGVTPEHVRLRSNKHGPDTCSFQLRRDPRLPHPDLRAWTDCDVHVRGVLVWSGQIRETPASDEARVISVQGRGWQYHLDDAKYERSYVHDRLSDWRDSRSLPTAVLDPANGGFIAAGQVSNDRAGITISFPGLTPLTGFQKCGVTLRFPSLIRHFDVEYTVLSGGGIDLVVSSHDQENPRGATWTNEASDSGLTTGETGTLTGNVGGREWLTVMLENPDTSVTWDNDITVRLRKIRVYAETAYESGNASVLQADDVVTDALDRATILLSTDRSQVAAGSFDLPSFLLDGPATAREAIELAAAVEDRDLKIDVDRRPIFKDRPTAPIYEAQGVWGARFSDASLNDGDAIFNHVIVTGTGADGAPISVHRYAGQQDDAVFEAVASPAPDNPSFATDTSGWTTSGGLTRDTSIYDTAPASGKWVPATTSATLSAAFTGTFLRGTAYRLSFRFRPSAVDLWAFSFGKVGTDHVTQLTEQAADAWAEITLAWTPLQNRTGVTLELQRPEGSGFGHVDSLKLYKPTATLVDRRGFIRTQELQVGNTLTLTLANRLGDRWLDLHRTTPLKGDVTVGPGGVRRALGGECPHPAWLLRDTGQMLRLSDRIDPDTGGRGRDGRIDTVEYDDDTLTATISLDNDRRQFEALLARLGAVIGSG